jgi:hypothetical protein
MAKTPVPDGEWLKTAPIKQIKVRVCSHMILLPSHYRENGTCKCDDPGELVMRSWGYKWSREKGLWV